MRKESGVQNLVIVILAVAVLVMSVGFALYNQSLTITGNTTVKAATWDVHFDPNVKTESGATSTALSVSGTTATFSVALEQPGDDYTLTLSAKNFGTINAKLTGITLSGLSAEQAKYVTYKVTVAGTDYTSNPTGLNVALNAEQSQSVVVYVKYELPANATDLPATDQNITLTATLNYADAVTS